MRVGASLLGRAECALIGAWARISGSQRNDHDRVRGLPTGASVIEVQYFFTKQWRRDLGGLPLAFELTEGQASDSPMFELLLDLGQDIKPRAAVGDKGYANRKNRAAARDRAICRVIPYKAKEKNSPRFFAKELYRACARIEQLVGKLKRCERIALRCEKTARNFGSFVALVFGFILVKSVHTT